MSKYNNDSPRTPLTPAQLDEWLYITIGKHADLYRQVLEPANAGERDAAFLEMSQLLEDAIEEVRVISVQLREESQEARLRATETVAESTRLLAECASSRESRILRIFHDGPRPRENMRDGQPQ
jgi:hypothetical protein